MVVAMRRTVIAWAAAGLVVAGACVGGGGGRETGSPGSTTSTTGGEDPTTSTSAPGGPGTDGETASGDECTGEPPIWALKTVDRTDDPDDSEDSDDGSGGSDGSGSSDDGSDDDAGSSGSSEGSGSSGSEDCEEVEQPDLGTGDVQITLTWESDADLDLHVTEPSGDEISYSDPGPTETGGQLDVDSNIGCENDGSVENVFWPEGDMPLGEYTVEVHGFTVDGCGGGDYTITAKVEGEEVLNETGSVGEDEEDVYTFEAR
jgi:hypothetical protein